jgi:AcrR family transcriptional regulator
MSYHKLDNIDEKIVDATIRVGSRNGANRLSTKEIAKECGISEFVIYDHFQSKENLINIADHKVFEISSAQAQELFDHPAFGFEEVWNGMIDWFLAHPDLVTWILNYGHIFPRAEKPADVDDFRADIAQVARRSFKDNSLTEDWEYCYVYMWLFRSMVCFAQFLITGELDNTPAIREKSFLLTYKGFMSFFKNN